MRFVDDCHPDRRTTENGGSKPERNLICYWHPGAVVADFDKALTESGWNILLADDPAAVEACSATHVIYTGIVFLDTNTPEKQTEEVYHVITSNPDVTWFALLKDRGRLHDPVCNLIAQCCSNFYSPPYDHEHIVRALGNVAVMSLIRQRSMDRHSVNDFEGMVGDSPPIRHLYEQVEKVARSDAPVVVSGESGTGKELTAAAVHHLSHCSSGPFVAVNCAAIPSTLIQSELFGHEKGAFTGAISRRIGRLEAANGGTLFLDEISDMPLEQQVNLLRFLEEKSIERLGGREKIPVDVRIIVATHDDLGQAVASGSFREDLFFRLNVLELKVPSLRERGADIDLLAEYVVKMFADECGCQRKKDFTKHALRAMRNYPWPGNVRELINRVRRALVMSEGRYITAIDLELENAACRSGASLKTTRAEVDKQAIESALTHSNDNISQAARDLGVSRTTLYRMMHKLNVKGWHQNALAAP